MVDAWKIVEDALSEVQADTFDRRRLNLLKMRALSVILALDGMRRHEFGSPPWQGFVEMYFQAGEALSGAVGQSRAKRVVSRIARTMAQKKVRLPR